MEDKEAFVTEVKNMQRNNHLAKLSWWEYCDTHYGGVRDPNRHEIEVLSDFITSFNAGALPPPTEQPAQQSKGKGGKGAWSMGVMNVPAGPATPADLMRFSQRQSQGWKEAWQMYCSAYGTGKFDPHTYDPSFIQCFLEFAGDLAMNHLGGPPQAQQGGGMPVQQQFGGTGLKRQGTGMAFPPGKRPNPAAPPVDEDPEKTALVEQVKNYQRSSPDAKNTWGSYCETHLAGSRDPRRHSVEILKAFLTEIGYGVN